MTTQEPHQEEPRISIVATAIHRTRRYGDFRICVAQNRSSKVEHAILIKGEVADAENVLCRLQSECLTGMVLDSATCECRDQLDVSLEAINGARQGLVILLRQEGRGHGLTKKIKALANKNIGVDTFTAVEMLGYPADIRDYGEAADILRLLSVRSIHLLTNNPDKIRQLKQDGILVQTVSSISIPPTEATIVHLEAKRQRGHSIDL